MLILWVSCGLSALGGTWTPVFTDDFNRPDSSTVGNGWVDPEGVGRIVNHSLTLTTPVPGSGTNLRVSRPVSETSLYQRIEASFIMPDTTDGMAHSAYVRGKSLVIAGHEIHPVMMVSVRHSGVLSMLLSYQGGGGIYPYPQGSGSFLPVTGHTYTLAVQVTNNFPAVLAATLTDNTTSAEVANITFSDFGQYIFSKTHQSPDFITPGTMGLAMEGSSGNSVSFTGVTTYAWTETGSLSAQFFPVATQHDGKTFLASPFPSGGTGPYQIRWYRGTNGFTPPIASDGSGAGTGTYLGDSWEQVDANPPAGYPNFGIFYRAVYFDSGANASSGVLGGLLDTRSPFSQSNAVPFWVGDSITAGYATSANNSSKSPATYAHAYLSADSAFKAAYTMPFAGPVNINGIPGRTSADAVNGLSAIIGQARIVGASFASIMLGTNDAKDSVATSPAQYQANIETIIAALKALRSDMKIVLNKPVWFQPDTGYGTDFSTASLGRVAQYHTMLAQLADGTSIVVGGLTAYNQCEIHGWSGTMGESNPANATTAYPPAPTGGKSYLVDGLHPYDGGSEMIAKLEWGPNARNAVLGNFTPIPTVTASGDQTIALPVSSVTVTGTATIGTGNIAGYAWSKRSGGPATIVSSAAATTEITGLTEGSYVFRLTATSNSGSLGTDEVNVTVNPPPTFTSWLTDNGLTGSAALPGADPDGNGFSNLVEYALGIPHESGSAPGLPTLGATSSTLTLTYPQLRTDIVYQPAWSDDAVTWDPTGITTTTTGYMTTASVPKGTNGRRFLRVVFIQQ